VRHPELAFCTMDHIVDTLPGRGDQTLMPGGTAFIQTTRETAQRAGIRLFDVRDPLQGIVHVISPEQGIVLPGTTVVCPDSHTCTQGALGALAWGIGSSEAEHVLATQTLRVARPRSMRVNLEGVLGAGVSAKDLMLWLIGRESASGAKGHAVEFAGAAVRALTVEARLTLCNLAVEFAAFTGMVAPDDVIFEYLAGRRFAPTGATWERAVWHIGARCTARPGRASTAS
jgi:3-isopropylmalate/(R)-2-methylmalate dehydratase large subunit